MQPTRRMLSETYDFAVTQRTEVVLEDLLLRTGAVQQAETVSTSARSTRLTDAPYLDGTDPSIPASCLWNPPASRDENTFIIAAPTILPPPAHEWGGGRARAKGNRGSVGAAALAQTAPASAAKESVGIGGCNTSYAQEHESACESSFMSEETLPSPGLASRLSAKECLGVGGRSSLREEETLRAVREETALIQSPAWRSPERPGDDSDGRSGAFTLGSRSRGSSNTRERSQGRARSDRVELAALRARCAGLEEQLAERASQLQDMQEAHSANERELQSSERERQAADERARLAARELERRERQVDELIIRSAKLRDRLVDRGASERLVPPMRGSHEGASAFRNIPSFDSNSTCGVAFSTAHFGTAVLDPPSASVAEGRPEDHRSGREGAEGCSGAATTLAAFRQSIQGHPIPPPHHGVDGSVRKNVREGVRESVRDRARSRSISGSRRSPRRGETRSGSASGSARSEEWDLFRASIMSTGDEAPLPERVVSRQEAASAAERFSPRGSVGSARTPVTQRPSPPAGAGVGACAGRWEEAAPRSARGSGREVARWR